MYIIILSRYIFIEINILIRIKILFSKYSIVSVCTRFGVHDTGYSLSPPLFSHSCLAKARARWNESERKPLVSLRLSDAVSLRRTQSVPSRSPLRPERSEKRTLGIRVAVHYTGYSPVPTSEYIRRQYCTWCCETELVLLN